ncbi:MAG: non-heme iron oxygenase ferredoxin subunit [Candidatus Micrarchaeota archaeon]|nr:non-heme iron oxygenase ferredoxin subunit [Candidatus Micrarchaeota archaeon]
MKVAKKSDVVEGKPFCAMMGGTKIAIFKVGAGYYAVDNACTHRSGPLCKGKLDGEVVECPWHGSKFNVKTGAVVGGPATKPVKQYKVRVVGEDIEVE